MGIRSIQHAIERGILDPYNIPVPASYVAGDVDTANSVETTVRNNEQARPQYEQKGGL